MGKGKYSKLASSSQSDYTAEQEYFGGHRPGNPLEYPDEVATADRLTTGDILPRDILDHPEWYFSSGNGGDDRETIATLRRIQGHPEAEVTIYRGSPKGELNHGDWVTLSRSYAEEYAGDSIYASRTGKAKVYSYTVKAGELSFDGDSLKEFGYWGKPKKAK